MKRVICIICLMLLLFTAGCRSWADDDHKVMDRRWTPQVLGWRQMWTVPTEKAKKLMKQRILKELAKRGKIETYGVADLLKVNTLTAFRYLEELEQEGKIEQISVASNLLWGSLWGEYKLKAE